MATSLFRTPRKQTVRFMLVPLIDVIFLLLTFFMLSSSIEPYSSIMLGEHGAQSEPGETEPNAQAAVRPDLVLSVSRGSVQANGSLVALADVAATLVALRRQGADTVIVFTRTSATVQDIVTVLDALKKAAFTSVTIRKQVVP
jgi:biopolymer transport protein ExbD